MDERLLAHARAAVGFLPDEEGLALHRVALAARSGPLLEIGAYCGKSGVYLGAAARSLGTVLFSVDHHRGSEENQADFAGGAWHDPTLVDGRTGRMDTLPTFRRTIEEAGLEDCVVAVVGDSPVVARWWRTPLAFLFVDGGHGEAAAHADYDGWTPHLAPGGLLAIHDVFPDPADGGRPPYELYCRALADGYEEQTDLGCGSLRVLRKPA